MNPVKLADAHEPEAIGETGIYRGKSIPYGSATIQVSTEAEKDWSHLNCLLAMIESCITDLRECGAEEVYVSCSLFHDGQCNFAFEKDQLRRLAALQIDLLISCYMEDIE